MPTRKERTIEGVCGEDQGCSIDGVLATQHKPGKCLKFPPRRSSSSRWQRRFCGWHMVIGDIRPGFFRILVELHQFVS
jgi:hypothetical protein